jgi:hypothetical protein
MANSGEDGGISNSQSFRNREDPLKRFWKKPICYLRSRPDGLFRVWVDIAGKITVENRRGNFDAVIGVQPERTWGWHNHPLSRKTKGRRWAHKTVRESPNSAIRPASGVTQSRDVPGEA